MKSPFSSSILAALALAAAVPTAARAQCAAQAIALKAGWNAVYIEVSPEQSASEVFDSWPTDEVGVYDPASFLATRQFSSDNDSEGLSLSPIMMWRRNYPDVSTVEQIPAGVVLTLFNNSGRVFNATLVGVPAAPRTTWHKTDADTVYNFFGFSVQDGASVQPSAYLDGFKGIEGTGGKCWKIGGTSEEGGFALLPGALTANMKNGEVLLLPSSEISDWSGALFVSPMFGLEFGTNSTLRTLEIRNDGEAERTVALRLDPAVAELSTRLAFSPDFLHWRDEDAARTNTAWNAIGAGGFGEIARKRLAAGETWRVAFGLDRTRIPESVPRGTPFGALLTALDLDGGSKMKATVPVRGEASGIAASATAWPAGLWVADVAFDSVRAPGAGEDTATGGTAKARLLLHVDGTGAIRLLQRVVAAGATAPDGTWSGRLYAGGASIPTTASEAMRLSSVVLPTETPVVAADPGGSLRDGATFRFAVAENGATSLLRHPLHPQHDGLRWDFKTPAPSGDDIDNYKLDVKPETFSVGCRIDLALALDGGEASWNPEAAKAGTCRWTFSGLMRQGDLSIAGPMTVKRVSPLAELVLE